MSFKFTNTDYKRLSEEDFEQAAEDLKCEVAVIKAVVEIESADGCGFLASSRPKILFESRIFNHLTGSAFLHHPLSEQFKLATLNWRRNYLGGEREYDRLEAALQLDEQAALRSCSWGLFQILGDNYKLLNYISVQDYVNAVVVFGEKSHLRHFILFIANTGLADELQEKNWHAFARRYNGPGYEKNRYDIRMQTAYERFKEGQPLAIGNRGVQTITQLQWLLTQVGARLVVDGILGAVTVRAIKDFQASHGLVVDGIAGPRTWGVLEKEAAKQKQDA